MQEEQTASARRYPAAGEYLIRIYVLLREGRRVVGARLAERMKVSPPAVTQALRRMARDGLVVQDDVRGVQLTDRGRGIAETTIRRHYLLEQMLVKVLGYNWAEVDEEADRLEHALSPQLEAHLYERLGHPSTCPHGNPFPGSPGERMLLDAPTLASVRPGERVTMLRVTEEGEEEPELMHMLLDHGMLPGAEISVTSASQECVSLAGPKGCIDMPLGFAELVRVSGPKEPPRSP